MSSTTLDRRVPSSVGRPVATGAVVDALLASPDGATIMATGLPYGGSGIVVALGTGGIVVTPRALQALADIGADLRDLVETWVENRAALVTNGQTMRRRAYGIWQDGETTYLDIIEIFPAEDLGAAIAAGRERNQISIWHAGQGREIPTGGTGEL